MNKINSLTPSQELEMLEYRAKWLKIGRSTEPADRLKAEAAITEMYKLLTKPKPYFWWNDGPAVGSMVRAILNDKKFQSNIKLDLESNLASNLWSNLGSNLWSNLESNLGSNLESNLGSNLES